MVELVKLIIGIGVLILGFPLGDLVARLTKEELESGQKYFRILVIFGLFGGILGLIIKKDVLLFTMFFIAIVSSRSIEDKRKKLREKNVKN